MVRAPCCERMGVKKGAWTREEDEILINYIHQYGHGNWRALPKQAGLLRCGKSCRLRWTNYLRPDIKRGNFSKEEEDTIITLHQLLGNRWSAIAARLPGRTDNEIKNVWHTHLKKRRLQLGKQNHTNTITHDSTQDDDQLLFKFDQDTEKESKPLNIGMQETSQSPLRRPSSPENSSSDVSSITADTLDNNNNNFPEVLDESFLSEVFWAENCCSQTTDFNFPAVNDENGRFLQFPFFPPHGDDYSNMHDGVDFWSDLFTGSVELPRF